MAMKDFRGHETPLAWTQGIKRRLRAAGHKYNLTDLIAMSRGGDPFLAGTRAEKEWAEWFMAMWKREGFGHGAHLRRIHYRLVVKGNVPLPDSYTPRDKGDDGTRYLNTRGYWELLIDASKAARYFGMLEPGAFIDKRSPRAITRYTESEGDNEPWADPESPDFLLPDLASLPDDWGTPPAPTVYGYQYDATAQPYLVELWVEKSTADEELLPICRKFGLNLQTSEGYQSITNITNLLGRARAAYEQGRPTRIFYISDFDPAGHHMPRAVARQIEFWLDSYAPGVDIKLTPLVLTHEQVKRYQLPRTPIDAKTESYSAAFEGRYGEGATELDALAALYPGVLEQIVIAAVRPYRDEDLESKYDEAAQEAIELVEERWASTATVERERIDSLRDAANTVMARYREDLQSELAPIVAELKTVMHDLQKVGQEFTDTIELPELPAPEVQAPDESDWYFDSTRNYAEQLQHYKARDNGKL